MTHAYQHATPEPARSWKRIHGNGEETHVYLIEHGDDYVVTAVDIDPRSYEAVASQHIGFEPTKESAEKKADAWMREHPKGVLGGGSEGSGLMQAIKKIFHRINEYGNQQVEEMQGGQG